ncbi:hypothetical protein PFI31113_01314 [Pandoraea fibrosis]|uniref:Uncharacterized protein n=1 Tax=Pandoraea fibrosis TaxID=1891094 RepID=A0A5E4TFS7_9BURK|nr:hypothetical protein PFI31113_01314 [Pandoraea fibrosis]
MRGAMPLAESDELLWGRLCVETISLQFVAFTDEFDSHFAKLFEDRNEEPMRYFVADVRGRARREGKDTFGERVEFVDGSVS